jgi:5-hydroxyisourate hydrolase
MREATGYGCPGNALKRRWVFVGARDQSNGKEETKSMHPELSGIEPAGPSGGISIHAVDIARGIPAQGLAVRLWRIDEQSRIQIAAGACGKDGLLDYPGSVGTGILSGIYEVEFEVGGFYRQAGIDMPNPSFVDVAIFRFGIDRVEEHFHLPFKFTPWGFSMFRGGA